jgi:hypothetical protein
MRYFTHLISITLLFSCSKEAPVVPPINDLACEEGVINLGVIELDTVSVSFVPYTGEETLVFKNANGDEARFVPLYTSLNHSFFLNDFDLVCMTGDTNHYEFNREQYAVSKKCEALNLQFYLNVYTQESFQLPIFYDIFSLNLHSPPLDFRIDTAVAISFVTSMKGNIAIPFEPDYYSSFYEFTLDTTLLNAQFQDVYFTRKPAGSLLPSLFFTKTSGIIAFQDLHDIMWIFDHTE